MTIDRAALAAAIDHTLLKPEATERDIVKLCDEALEYGFAAVCANGIWVHTVATRLAGSAVMPCAVIGFPLGATLTAVKAFEARAAIDAGAREIDMVMPIGHALSGNWHLVRADIAACLGACAGTPLKVILETCLLDDGQIVRACEICRELGVAFVKTSTGFSTHGATLEHVRLMRAAVGEGIGVKASGGIRDRATALAMLEAGATRLGCSAGVAIITADGPDLSADY